MLILVSTVFGAISGVGIRVAAGLISPATISALIRNYVWGGLPGDYRSVLVACLMGVNTYGISPTITTGIALPDLRLPSGWVTTYLFG